MKRLLITLLACAVVMLTVGVSGVMQTQPAIAIPFVGAAPTDPAKANADLMEHIKTNVLPQIESILTTAQRDKIETAMADGKTSLRKVFKSIVLTPEQKQQLAAVLKTMPKKDALATLTPEQKKQFFMKKKDGFMPTPEEITEKISAGMKNKGSTMPDEVSAKISEKMKAKEGLMPSPEAIGAKISAGMQKLQDKIGNGDD